MEVEILVNMKALFSGTLLLNSPPCTDVNIALRLIMRKVREKTADTQKELQDDLKIVGTAI